MSEIGCLRLPHDAIQLLEGFDISLTGDGLTLLRFKPKDSFELSKGVLTIRAESSPRQIDGLVGLAGAYFNPKLVSASNPEDVFTSWKWLRDRIGKNVEQLLLWLTTHYILKMIFRHQLDLELMAPISLFVRLRRLSDYVNTEVKIRQLARFFNGNVKRWVEYEPTKLFQQADSMVRYLSNLDSETDFALIAKLNECDVELSSTPDMYVNGVGVEVKDLSWDQSLPTQSYVRKIIERSQKAFSQKARLAVLSIGVALELLKLTAKGGSQKEMNLRSTLRRGLRLAKENRKPVLLLYHDPWTDSVTAQVQTLNQLKEILANNNDVQIITTLRQSARAYVH